MSNSSEDSPQVERHKSPEEVAKAQYRKIRNVTFPRTEDDEKLIRERQAGLIGDKVNSLMILVNSISDSGQARPLENWERDAPTQSVYLLRRDDEGNYEASPEAITRPRTPKSFYIALEAFIDGKPWDEVKRLAATRPPEASDPDAAEITTLQTESAAVATLEEAGEMAAKIHRKFSKPSSQTKVMQVLHRQVERIIENDTRDVTELEQLNPLRARLQSFVTSSNGKYFVGTMFVDFIDAAALRIGQLMIASARSAGELERVLTAIRAHEFQYAEAYAAPFAESREDALEKIELLAELTRIRSVERLDAFKEKIATKEFKSASLTSLYRSQIDSFIERKRRVYAHQSPDGNKLEPLTK